MVGSSFAGMNDDLPELDAAALLAASSEAVRARRLAEVRDLGVLAQWAAVHSGDPVQEWDTLIQLGGEGTPGVQDFCLGEIALARGTGVTATTNAVADVLDLLFRLPRTWKVCEIGEAEIQIARRVAKLSRHLPADRVAVVDRAVARIIGHESGGRVLAVAEAKIIEADPALHEERVEAERRRRYVSSTRTDEFGLRTVIARVEAGDVVWVEAILARVAEILAPRYPEASADELRAIAFGWLARPAELLQLLLEHRNPQEALEPELEAQPGDGVPGRPARGAPCGGSLAVGAEGGVVRPPPRSSRPRDRWRRPRRRTRPDHPHRAAGPPGRTQLTIKPVLDLSERVRTTAYEHPESLKERVHLTTGGDYWPYATSTNRRVDYDHPTPYDDTGPPGQTGTHNSGPLGRRHHRWKTHAGYRARQCGPGRYVWLTPHGLGFTVDHHGTRRISAGEARLILDAPPGVDIYPVARSGDQQAGTSTPHPAGCARPVAQPRV